MIWYISNILNIYTVHHQRFGDFLHGVCFFSWSLNKIIYICFAGLRSSQLDLSTWSAKFVCRNSSSSNTCSRIEIPINFNDDILWNCVFYRTICYIRSSMFTRYFRYCEGRGWAFWTNIFKAWCTSRVSSINDSNKNHKINSCIAYILAFTSISHLLYWLVYKEFMFH